MDKKNILLIAIVILVIALAAVAAFIYTSDSNNPIENITSNTTNKTVIDVDKASNTNNTTVVGDNSTRANDTANLTNNNTPYKVYNPQSDSYVPVIGEKYDSEVNRWYTYDEDGVRYYNTRIN